MYVLSNLRDFKPERARALFLGLGNFDGVHVGHQALFARVLSEARAKHGHAALFTFQGHPQSVLHPDQKTQLLVSDEQKLFLFSRAGFDFCLRLHQEGLVNDEYCDEERTKLLARILNEPELTSEFHPKVFIPGLMTGQAGIVYELLRIVYPDKVPSILSLNC